MHGFLKDLERAEEEYRQEVKAIREKLGVPAFYTETLGVERYSLAVQVFAAFAIEALIRFYAVLRFGGENYDQYFAEGGAANRLQRALQQAGIAVADDAEILMCCASRDERTPPHRSSVHGGILGHRASHSPTSRPSGSR